MKIEKNSRIINMLWVVSILDVRHNDMWFSWDDIYFGQDLKNINQEDLNLILELKNSEVQTTLIYLGDGEYCEKNQKYIFNVEFEIYNNEIIRYGYEPIGKDCN